jgi:hypothetical protein
MFRIISSHPESVAVVQVGSSDCVALGMGDKIGGYWSAIPNKRDRLKLLQSIVYTTLKQKESSVRPWKDICDTEIIPHLSTSCPRSPYGIIHSRSTVLAKQFYSHIRPRWFTPLRCVCLHIPSRFSCLSVSTVMTVTLMTVMILQTKGSHSPCCTKQFMTSCLATWSERRFVQHVAVTLQRRVTNYLQTSIPLLHTTLSSSSSIAQSILRGVRRFVWNQVCWK